MLKEKLFDRKTELVEAALNEFIVKNYEDASLNNIIKNAGISKGTFYYHFRNKQELYLFLSNFAVDAKWEFINKRMKDLVEEDSGKDIFEKFKLQARIGAEFANIFPKYHKLGRMFSKEKGNEIYDAAIDLLGKSTEALLENMIDKAINDGDFSAALPRDFVVKTVRYLFMHFDEVFEEETYELDKTIKNLDHFVDFMKYGMGK